MLKRSMIFFSDYTVKNSKKDKLNTISKKRKVIENDISKLIAFRDQGENLNNNFQQNKHMSQQLRLFKFI